MTTATEPAQTPPGQAESADALVVVQGLTKRYGQTPAVDGLDLTVRRGEVYGFLGPNGAGKTTTLRILLGLVRPSEGRIQVLGCPPGDPRGLARVGALVEAPAFYPYLSGRDNLRLIARYAAVGSDRVEGALAAVELSDRARDKFRTYSLGMKQRLGVAAALLKNPDLLILDEPTNGLDPAGMADMRALLRQLARSGQTVLLSSHLLGEVQQICDRVGVIVHGRLVAESTVEQLRGRQSLEIVAGPPETAWRVLADLVGEQRLRREGDRVAIAIDPARAAELNRALVQAGVAVHELRRSERSLEDVFLEMTTAGTQGDR